MASCDEWKKGFCTDGGMDVKIRANDVYQWRGNVNKKIFTQYICNSYNKCTQCYRCKYSADVQTNDTLNPRIIEQ